MIEDRLNLVEELINDMPFYNSLRNILTRFPDLDSVLNLCVKKPELSISNAQIDAKIDRMVALKQILQLLPTFHEILSKSESTICVKAVRMLHRHVHNSSLLLEMMQLVLIDSTNIGGRAAAASQQRLSRMMAVKQDVNGLLDLARTTFCEYVEQLEAEVERVSSAHDVAMKLANSSKGFCIQMNNQRHYKVNINKLPDEFLRIVKNKAGITFVTQEFVVIDSLAKDSLVEISKMSNAILNELLSEVREYIGFLYSLSETIATLDMLVAFANVSMNEEFVKPEFGDSHVIRGGRHPILEKVRMDVTPNDTMLEPLSRLQVLTNNINNNN